MAEATAQEQLFLELINRARLDPAGEAARYGITLNQGLSPGTIDPESRQVLAFSGQLNSAADAHSSWMLATDQFSHTGQGGSDPGARMRGAGYVFSGSWTWGENIAWSGTTGTLDIEQAVYQQHRNLFMSAGHRANILGENFREAGIGAIDGRFTSYNALMTTENFAASGSSRFVTGVIYDDEDGDNFYSMGEGSGGHTVQIVQGGSAIATTSSGAAGGFALGTTLTGAIEVWFSGGGLPGAMGVAVTLGASNIKIDLVDGDTILSNVKAALTGAAARLQLIGIENIAATANAAGSTITGNAAANVLKGLEGADVLNGAAGNDRLNGGGGNDRLTGGAGADRLSGGTGKDVFVFAAADDTVNDLVLDFIVRRDGIDLSAIDAIAGGANNAFTLIGGAFTGSAGELRYEHTPTRTLVMGDTNGDGVADFTIRLAGVHMLTAGDFIL